MKVINLFVVFCQELEVTKCIIKIYCWVKLLDVIINQFKANIKTVISGSFLTKIFSLTKFNVFHVQLILKKKLVIAFPNKC